jgi:hypothetical protein
MSLEFIAINALPYVWNAQENNLINAQLATLAPS